MHQDAPHCYREFWPLYLRAHSRKATQRLHLLATVAGALTASLGLAQGEVLAIPASVAVAYGISIPSHLLVEGNIPTAGRHPLWSAMADVKMCALLLTGRMGTEMQRLGIRPGEPQRRRRVQSTC